MEYLNDFFFLTYGSFLETNLLLISISYISNALLFSKNYFF